MEVYLIPYLLLVAICSVFSSLPIEICKLIMLIQLHEVEVKTHRVHYSSTLVNFTYFIFKENSMHVIAYVQRSLTYTFNNMKLEHLRHDYIRYQSDPFSVN